MERLKLAAERGRDQQRFVLELRKVADGLRAEAQRASRGEDAQVSVRSWPFSLPSTVSCLFFSNIFVVCLILVSGDRQLKEKPTVSWLVL